MPIKTIFEYIQHAKSERERLVPFNYNIYRLHVYTVGARGYFFLRVKRASNAATRREVPRKKTLWWHAS